MCIRDSGNFAGIMQNRTDGADRSFDFVFTGVDAIHEGESGDEADGAVATHSEVSDVVKEDDSGGTSGIDGFAEQGSDDHVGTARFVDDGGAKIVVPGSKNGEPVMKRSISQVRAATDDQAGGLTSSVGIDHSDFSELG